MDESTFRSRLHSAIGEPEMPAHVGDQTRRALKEAGEGEAVRPQSIPAVVAVILAVAIVAGLVGVNIARRGHVPATAPSPAAATPTPTPVQGHLLVFTAWAPDAKVGNGPEPGYKPALTGLTGHDIKSATAVINDNGVSWVVNIAFTGRGTDLFAQLTRANVAACPGDPTTGAGYGCPQRHLGIWVDLTQADIDRWEDPTYVGKVSQPFDLTCLGQPATATICPKFVSDPVTLQEIDGGNAQIGGNFTQQSAHDLASAINAANKS